MRKPSIVMDGCFSERYGRRNNNVMLILSEAGVLLWCQGHTPDTITNNFPSPLEGRGSG